MGLHPALEVKSFDTYGFACRGLFVKDGCRIAKGERVWWFDRHEDAPIRSFTKHGILTAPTESTSWSPSPTKSPVDRKHGAYTYSRSSVEECMVLRGSDDGLVAYPATPPVTPISNDLSPPLLVSDRRDSMSTLKAMENIPTLPFLPNDGGHKVEASYGSLAPTPSRTVGASNPRELLVTYSYMMDDDLYISTTDPTEDVSYFYNHSCTANTAYDGDDLVVALRDIQAHEQVVYDYAFTETQDSLHAGMACRCGTAACRGTLDFLQYKDPAFIAAHYHHCTSFIQRKMRENGWVHHAVVRRRTHLIEAISSLEPDDEPQYGLYACAPIPRGTPILMFAGKIVSGRYIESVSRREQEMSLQIDHDLWQIPNRVAGGHNDTSMDNGGRGMVDYAFETGDYINHSCRPNCGMLDAIRVVTMRDIAVDEALTIDYAMVNTGVKHLAGEIFDCRCGAIAVGASWGGPNETVATTATTQPFLPCRGTITALDYQLVGSRYTEYLSPFVRDAYHEHANRFDSSPGGTVSPDAATPDSATNNAMTFAMGDIQNELNHALTHSSMSSPLTVYSTSTTAAVWNESLQSIDLGSTPSSTGSAPKAFLTL